MPSKLYSKYLNVPQERRVARVKVTPELAQEIIDNDEVLSNYRRVNQSTVRRYASDMANGNWQYNYESIHLIRDPNGNWHPTNGQHRLRACIASNVPFETDIVYHSTASTFDRGQSRTLANELTQAGEINCSTLGAVLHLIARAKFALQAAPAGTNRDDIMADPHQWTFGQRGHFRPSTEEQLELLRQHPEVRRYTNYSVAMPWQKSQVAYMMWVHKRHATAVKAFFDQIATKQGWSKGSPSIRLYDLINSGRLRGVRYPQHQILIWMDQAIRAHITGSSLRFKSFARPNTRKSLQGMEVAE